MSASVGARPRAGKLSAATPILGAAVEQRKLRVVGGVYGLKDGRVEMLT